ncbi:MAG: type VI secretion system tip protein VgrG [Gemmatimonadaceae bacterium]|nr:type VI secretion system tip protein VgrG [Gemmatimonadaceae bacterium]
MTASLLAALLPSLDVAQRPLRMESECFGTSLLPRVFTCTESLSTGYEVTVEVLAREHDLDAESALRTRMTLLLDAGSGVTRKFHGRVASFHQMGSADGFTAYRVTLVPWLSLLELSTDCRIFQRETVRQIIAKTFTELGWSAGTDFEDKCTGTYEPRRFVVQYRETHLNFVARLMEEEGIWYWFDHEGDREKLVLADANSTTPEHALPVRVVTQAGAFMGEDVLTSLYRRADVHTGRTRLATFDFKQPSTPLSAQRAGSGPEEVYDYQGPAHFETPEAGARYARIRLEESTVPRVIVSGAGNVRSLRPGLRITVAGHERDAVNRQFLIVGVSHTGSGGNLRDEDAPFDYGNAITAIPADVPYRAPRVARKPVMRGSQTAIVVGPPGEEIWTDEFGRVKLHFHWDHRSQRNDESSCWVRVSSPWAGKNWGAVHIPRIGQEVIVEWLEGDSDMPIVTGRVYNADQPVPYGLPANATQSGIKSRSSKGAGPANFNEIRMEDKKGEEQLYIHAEKNEDIVVENDKTEDVGRNETITIGNDREETVGHDETLTVKNNRTRHVHGTETVTVNLLRFHNVGINEMINVGAAQEVTIGGFRNTAVGLFYNEVIGGWMKTTVMQSQTVDVKQDITITSGTQITLQTGASSLLMKADGTIVLKGKTIMTDSSEHTQVKAGGNIAHIARLIKNNG